MLLKVKVCGMRERYNIEALSQLPIDFVGLIFYEKSSRFLEAVEVDLDYLKADLKSKENFPRKISKVGVFVNEDLETVLEKVKFYHLDYVQLHGDENVFYCKKLHALGIKIIKAFPVDEAFSFTNLKAFEYYCEYFLFDTKGKLPGGNGVAFNWEVLKKYEGETPFFLSGGLGPGMEIQIINLEHPQFFGIDLNSGFENTPGFKNIDLLSDFIYKIREGLKGQHEDWGA
jgi:phosphoribosylanthranilate isomerase